MRFDPQVDRVMGLSLWQPWASLMATGAKVVETRSWPTRYRGWLLICASKGGLGKHELIRHMCRWDVQGGLAPLKGQPIDRTARSWAGVNDGDLPFGHGLVLVELYDCRSTNDLRLTDVDNFECGFGDYNPDRYAWFTRNRIPLTPFPVRGRQGLFSVALPDRLAEVLV